MAQPRRTSKQSKQAGGTFLGIVLGLIVGLAIAVVVALYITRSPSPFVSKVAPPPADNGATSRTVRSEPRAAGQDARPAGAAGAQPAPPNTAPGRPRTRPRAACCPNRRSSVPPQATGRAARTTPAARTTRPRRTIRRRVTASPSRRSRPTPRRRQEDAASAAATAARRRGRPRPLRRAEAGAASRRAKAAATATGREHAEADLVGHGRPTAKPPTANDANTGYFLQVGAYKTEGDAERNARASASRVSSRRCRSAMSAA